MKGFFLIPTPVPLDVVAVYTTGTASGPASIDVETIAPRAGRACPDLTVLRFDRPTVFGSSTRVTLYVANVGTEAAPLFTVYVEDPGHAGPERIQTVSAGPLSPSASATVTVTFPYSMSGSSYMAAIVGVADPKDLIAECREDNNKRTVGAQP